jgi:hypothetical protein
MPKLPVGQFWVQLAPFTPQITALAESAIARRAFIYAAGQVIEIHWRKGWDSNPRWHRCHARFRVECLQPDSATLPIGYKQLITQAKVVN